MRLTVAKGTLAMFVALVFVLLMRTRSVPAGPARVVKPVRGMEDVIPPSSEPLPTSGPIPSATKRQGTAASGASQISFDIFRIVEGEATEEKPFKQLHHGIYRVVTRQSRVQFALKTECRPASKWHGQQGWTEIAAHAFVNLLFADNTALATVPPARGVTVKISKAMLSVLHKDRCGVIEEVEDGGALLIGVALTWQPRHDDGALASLPIGKYFKAKAALPAKDRPLVDQVATVNFVDYLLGNEDREEKNWFWGDGRKNALIMMDNGWDFAGRGYKESICSTFTELLQCPPVLRFWSKSSKCSGGYNNCRFSKYLVDRAATIKSTWDEKEGPEWRQQLAADPLIAYLLSSFQYQVKRRFNDNVTDAKGGFNMGIARFTSGCGDLDLHAEVSAHHPVLVALSEGIKKRLAAAVLHMDSCVVKLGQEYVVGTS